MDEDLEDLQGLLRVVAAAPPAAAGPGQPKRRGRPPGARPRAASVDQGVPPQPLPAAEQDDSVQDLAALIELGNAQPRRCHERRSWQAADHARNSRSLRLAREREARAVAREQQTQSQLQEVASQFPMVARACGVRVQNRPMDEARAVVQQKLAFQPTVRTQPAARLSQSRAASLVATCAKSVQDECIQQKWSADGPRQGARPDPLSFHSEHLHWQWDETTQKVRMHLAKQALKGERMSSAPVSKQVMMQNGSATSVFSSASGDSVVSDPILSQGLLLDVQNTRTILAGIQKRCPFKFGDLEFSNKVEESADVFIISFCCDRATVNSAVMRVIWSLLQAPGMPPILPFAEFCGAHGAALIKKKPSANKTLVATASTLSSCFRQDSFAQAFRDALIRIVSLKLKVQRQARPAAAKVLAEACIEMLFGDESSEYLYRTTTDGRRIPTKLYEDLQNLAEAVDLGAVNEDMWNHWCFVEENSELHRQGREVGSPCCDSRQEAVEKVAVAMLNFLLHRQWMQSAASRWTYVGITMRKIAIGLLSNRILPDVLSDMQALWGAKGSVESLLARLVAADAEDFQSRSKLRLLRCCEAFVPVSAGWRLGIQITVSREVDKLLYSFLGDGTPGSRAGLAFLVDEGESPIAGLLQELLMLLRDWRADAPHWRLLAAMGGDFTNDEVRRLARQMILPTGAAGFDYFEQRMSHAPFTLFKLGDARVPRSRQRAIGTTFFKIPEHCLSLFCLRLRKSKCPNLMELLETAPKIMKALDAGAQVAIDQTERSHAGLRVDLRSTGQAANFTDGVNRFFCQQFRALHIAAGGEDPAATCRSGSASSAAVATEPLAKRRRSGGNPRQKCWNFKLAAYKARIAPDRP